MWSLLPGVSQGHGGWRHEPKSAPASQSPSLQAPSYPPPPPAQSTLGSPREPASHQSGRKARGPGSSPQAHGCGPATPRPSRRRTPFTPFRSPFSKLSRGKEMMLFMF